MSYEYISDYIDKCVELHNEVEPYREKEAIYNCLLQYYLIVLSRPKFRGQRRHGLMSLFYLDYVFSSGFFKSAKSKPTKFEVLEYFDNIY